VNVHLMGKFPIYFKEPQSFNKVFNKVIL